MLFSFRPNRIRRSYRFQSGSLSPTALPGVVASDQEVEDGETGEMGLSEGMDVVVIYILDLVLTGLVGG